MITPRVIVPGTKPITTPVTPVIIGMTDRGDYYMVWIIIAIVIAFVLYKNSSAVSTGRKPKAARTNEGITSDEWMAKQQIDRINDAISNGDYATAARESDDTLQCIGLCKTDAERYAFLQKICDASLMYFGNKYPDRRDSLLEDLVREEIRRTPV